MLFFGTGVFLWTFYKNKPEVNKTEATKTEASQPSRPKLMHQVEIRFNVRSYGETVSEWIGTCFTSYDKQQNVDEVSMMQPGFYECVFQSGAGMAMQPIQVEKAGELWVALLPGTLHQGLAKGTCALLRSPRLGLAKWNVEVHDGLWKMVLPFEESALVFSCEGQEAVPGEPSPIPPLLPVPEYTTTLPVTRGKVPKVPDP